MFNYGNFNVIEDDKYYYVFRALNRADHNDIISGITTDEEGNIERIRTDRERFVEENDSALYSEDSEISLEEMWNHIKMKYSKETNCISLSMNANVALDYGSSYFDEYAIVRVPKSGAKDIYAAGKYMIEEVNKKISQTISEFREDFSQELIDILNTVVYETDNEKLINHVKSYFEKRGFNFSNIASRFQDRQYFNNLQQINYNRMVARLTLLEVEGILPSVLSSQTDNTSLLATIGNAFSSGEVIHYKDIDGNDFIPASKRMMNLLAIVQQLKDKNYSDEVKKLEQILIKLVTEGYDIEEKDGKMVITNGFDTKPLSISPSASIFTKNEIDCNMLTIDNVYKLTNGKISYLKAKKTTEFIYSLALSKKHAIEYSSIIYDLTGDTSLSDRIKDEVFAIDSKIIDRSNNSGYQLCESVNIGMSNEKNSFYSIKDQKKLIESFSKFNLEGVDKVLNNNPETFIKSISTIVNNKSLSKEEYYARAIFETIDYKKIFTYSKKDNFSISEEELLITNLSVKNIDRLYNAFVKLNISDCDIAAYIINLLLEGVYKDYTFEELCNLDNIDSFIEENIHKLNLKINPMLFNEYFGIDDNSNKFAGTNLSLRDYQMNAKENADRMYESGRRFAGVVLPTGAGKSFIIMAEMLERRNQNIVYIAPRIGIIRQLKKNIVKYIAGLEPGDYSDLEQDLIVKKYFPHFECYCYQGLSSSEEEKLKRYSADFIILDEIHHLGAEKWNPAIRNLLSKNKDSKVLGVTATPERDENREDRDTLKELAILLDDYTKEELTRKDYLACNMSLIEGIQEGYIVCPNIVSFDYFLDETAEYKELITLMGKIDNPQIKLAVKQKFQQIEDIVSKAKLEGVDEIFKKYIKSTDGKYILFIPRKNGGGDSISYIERYIEEFKKELALVDPNPIVSYIFSTKPNNSDVIREFEKDNVTGHLKILAAVDMFNEGIHLDKLNGSFNDRKIDSSRRILKFQHLGRVVYGIDPNNPPKDEDRPIVFDRYNNYFTLEFEREINRTKISSDLDKLKNVIFWINKYGYIPQTDAIKLGEKRKALTLKKLKTKYSKYVISNEPIENKNEEERYEIEQIIELGKTIDLWTMEFAPISREEIRKIEHVELIKVGATRRTFLELCSVFKNTLGIKNLENKERLKILSAVLDLFVEYNITPIAQEIYDDNDNLYQNYIREDDTLISYLERNNKDAINYILDELAIYGITGDYLLGVEFYYIRKRINGNDSMTFRGYNNPEHIIELGKEGLLSNGDDYTFVDDKGFIKCNLFYNKNIYTGTDKDEDGYDYAGLDSHGFNRQGFYRNREGRLSKYDDNGFDVNHIHFETHTKYDPHGFDINGIHKDTLLYVNEAGFNQQGIYVIVEKDAEKGYRYTKTGYRYDPEGYNIDGFNQEDFDRKGIHKTTKLPYDERGFDKDHFYWKEVNGKRVKTKSFLDEDHKNYKGDLFRYSDKLKKYVKADNGKDNHGFWGNTSKRPGIHSVTGTKYDTHGFDVDGYWHRYNDETGEYEETGSFVNDEGWNIDCEKLVYNVHGVQVMSFVDEFGFDIDGLYHEPRAQYDENGFKKLYGGDIHYYKHPKHLYKYDVHGFDCNGIHRDTGTFLNESNFDRRGYYYKQDENGEFVNTWRFTDDEGWTIDKRFIEFAGVDKDGNQIINYTTVHNGFNIEGEQLEFGVEKKKVYDRHGFDEDGIHYITGTNINEHGFDKQGFWHYTDENGEDINSGRFTNDEGWTIDHETIVETINAKGEKEVSFEKYREGFDYKGVYHDSRGRTSKYNPKGFDYRGIHNETGTHLDPRDFDAYGYWYIKKDGMVINTFSRYDSNGWSQTGVNKYSGRIVDPHGFNINHLYRKKDGTFSMTDPHGFDCDGIHEKTNTKLNKRGFNIDGFWYEEKNGRMVNSGSYFDKDGFNIDGFDKYGFRRCGSYKYGGKYNPDGFDCHGIHKDTDMPYNLQGINIDGEQAITVDWDLIKQKKQQEILSNKMDIQTLFDLMNPNDRKQAAYSIDPDTYEIEDEDTFEIFFENVSKYCINEYNEKYSEDDVLEFLVEKRREFDEELANDSKLEFYLYSKAMNSDDEKISINKYI